MIDTKIKLVCIILAVIFTVKRFLLAWIDGREKSEKARTYKQNDGKEEFYRDFSEQMKAKRNKI